METSSQTESSTLLSTSDAENFNVAMPPLANQAHAVSGAHIALPRPSTCCTLSSNPTRSPLTPLSQNSLPNYGAISSDSPTNPRGILKAIGDGIKCLFCCWLPADTPPGDETSTVDDRHSALFERPRSNPIDIVPPVHLAGNENEAALISSNSGATSNFFRAIHGLFSHPNLIGDYSKPFALPLVKSPHADLKAISSETLVKLIQGEFSDSVKDFLVVDCRYPYEYDGGHIVGAKNIYNKKGIVSNLLSGRGLSSEMGQTSILVFHCEFSSKRAPTVLRFLHEMDRVLNKDVYPRLYHPEIYVLEGGYKAFYAEFKALCEPQNYIQMLDEDHRKKLTFYNRKFHLEFGRRPRI